MEDALTASALTRPVDEVAPKPMRRDGLLRQLTHTNRVSIRKDASVGLTSHVYDNINMVFSVAEQILGRKNSQQNGTCATAFHLFGTTPNDLKTSKLLQSYDSAGPLSLLDVTLTLDERRKFQQRLQETVLRIIVRFGGDHFQQFSEPLAESLKPHQEIFKPLFSASQDFS